MFRFRYCFVVLALTFFCVNASETSRSRIDLIQNITPLQEAVGNRDYNSVKKLLNEGGDPNETFNGLPLVCLALQANQLEIAYLLIECGAKIIVKNKEMPLLHFLVSSKNEKAMAWALNKGYHPNISDKHAGTTALHVAAHIGSIDFARILLEHGADINIADNDKLMSLHYAAMNGQYDMLQFLLEHGADINATDKTGKTPLNYAAGNKKIEQLLMDNGATKGFANRGPRLVEKISEKATTIGILILLLIGLRKLFGFVFKRL